MGSSQKAPGSQICQDAETLDQRRKDCREKGRGEECSGIRKEMAVLGVEILSRLGDCEGKAEWSQLMVDLGC